MAAFFDKTRARAMSFEAGEAIMWRLVQRYTGQVGYQRGVKSVGLSVTPPIIDCSGWTALLLMQAMQAENDAAGRDVFGADDMLALQVWSDRIIHEVETRTGFILEGPEITAASLPRYATLGLKMGEPAWATNHPRPRGITHIVQVVRRPEDGAPFVSEAFGGSPLPGISLTPLAEWLALAQPRIRAGEVWAVDPFRMAAR
jgi:hypothetical protein